MGRYMENKENLTRFGIETNDKEHLSSYDPWFFLNIG